MKKNVFIAFILLLTTITNGFAFDPFADPPKNMEESSGMTQPQNTEEIGIPPPPTFFGEEEKPAAPENSKKGMTESYSGKLTWTESKTNDNRKHYILETDTENIPMETAKDLDMFVGQQVTVFVERLGTTLSIKSLTVSETSTEKFMDSLERRDPSREKSLENTSTGPKAWVFLAIVLLVLGIAMVYGYYYRKKKIAIKANEKEEYFHQE